MEKIRHRDEELFYDAILTLKTPADCRAFFEDICTIKELQSIAQRFRVEALLDEGRNYLEVSEETGASSATISPSNRSAKPSWCWPKNSGVQHAFSNSCTKNRPSALPGIGGRKASQALIPNNIYRSPHARPKA